MTRVTPFFTVIVTTYNASATIERTLDSVFHQTFRDFEVIIIDDHSNDDTVARMNAMLQHDAQDGVQLIVNHNNRGVSYTRNQGITASHGQYLSFLDGDDLWTPDKLQVQADVITQQGAEWVFANYTVIDAHYHLLSTRYRTPGTYGFEEMITNGNPVGLLTVVLSRKLLDKHRFSNVPHEDYDLWLELAAYGHQGVLINAVLASYMKKSDSVSNNKFRTVGWTYQIFRRHNISRTRAVGLLVSYARNVISRRRGAS